MLMRIMPSSPRLTAERAGVTTFGVRDSMHRSHINDIVTLDDLSR